MSLSIGDDDIIRARENTGLTRLPPQLDTNQPNTIEMAANTRASAIGLALNKQSASLGISAKGFNIGRDNFTGVSTNPSARSAMLPTPPTSISPNLPPQRQDESTAQESDFDLHDAPGNALTAEALDSLGDLDSAGAITPAMLAKHHLPEILLSHGPLAIRHIMSYLNSTVPGFARITSAKARRLVVAALEGRGAGLDPIGDDGEVIFEKVGWGRWDARRRGQPTRDGTPPASYTSSFSGSGLANRGDHSGASASGRYSSEEDHDVLEHEADKMSLDDDEGGYASSEAPPADPMLEDFDDGDVTDEEDWESIGAEALRARSLPPGSLPNSRIPSGGGRIYQPIYPSRPQRHASYNVAQSVPVKAMPAHRQANFNIINDSQERAAIEALLSLGSM